MIQAEAMVKYKQCEEMIDTILNNKSRSETERHEAIMNMIGSVLLVVYLMELFRFQ